MPMRHIVRDAVAIAVFTAVFVAERFVSPGMVSLVLGSFAIALVAGATTSAVAARALPAVRPTGGPGEGLSGAAGHAAAIVAGSTAAIYGLASLRSRQVELPGLIPNLGALAALLVVIVAGGLVAGARLGRSAPGRAKPAR